MTKDEAFQEYKETVAKINRESKIAKEGARAKLNANLRTIRLLLHNELKAIRTIQQKEGR